MKTSRQKWHQERAAMAKTVKDAETPAVETAPVKNRKLRRKKKR